MQDIVGECLLVGDELVDLLLESLGQVGVLGHAVEHKAQQMACSVDPGEVEADQLLDHLFFRDQGQLWLLALFLGLFLQSHSPPHLGSIYLQEVEAVGWGFGPLLHQLEQDCPNLQEQIHQLPILGHKVDTPSLVPEQQVRKQVTWTPGPKEHH